jgi:hypothetical protein
MPEIKGGYYIKARCIQESEIQHAPPHVREIWDWFIMKANHAPYKKHGNTFERGQLLCSYADIQEALHWTIGWRKKTYSKADCETAMKWLKKRVMVTTRKTTRGMIVTICNYDRFQNPENYETYIETSKKPTTNLQTDDTINKKKENKKNERKSKDLSPEILVKGWNDICGEEGLTKVIKLTPERRSKVNARIKTHSKVEFWTDVINEIPCHPFLMGKNDRKWKADFDWLMANDTNAVKVLEGKYKNDRT